MDPSERLELIMEQLGFLDTLSEDHVIVVEGRKDVESLNNLGIEGDFMMVQVSGGPIRIAECLWNNRSKAVILTDWDRRGDLLAEDLKRNMDSLQVRYNIDVRKELSHLCRPFCKDVESLHTVVSLLESRINSTTN